MKCPRRLFGFGAARFVLGTAVFTMATDLFPSRTVGSVSGFGGVVAGMVSIGIAEAVGRVLDLDAILYAPIFIAAALLYPLALGVFQWLSPKLEPVAAELNEVR